MDLDKNFEMAVGTSIRRLRYLLCYKAIVNQLNDQIEILRIHEDVIARKVAAENNDGRFIDNRVLKWLREVENIKSRADELSRLRPSWTCFKVVQFPDPVNRFRLGRKAACLAKDVVEVTFYGQEWHVDEIAYLPPTEDVPVSDAPYQAFGSREEAYKKLWEALVKEDGHPIIGIYGMAGVGKTLMMEQACKQAKDMKIFDNFTRANVGSTEIDVVKLQDQIAFDLDKYLSSYDVVRRASELKDILEKKGKTLVILDDAWDFISLHNIGIPVGNGKSDYCKILLTSRSQQVCLDNDCRYPIEIKPLTIDESLEMFKNTVGTSKIEFLSDASLANKLCKECAGLPLLISEVGKALEFVAENLWKDALYQMENGKFEAIDGRTAQVYGCLLKSFEKLRDAEKTCLLLCSLFPQDADIEIKMLFDLATGSLLLNRGANIYELIDNLKSSSMLLQGKDDYSVKIHDIIRNVARSIAARDPEYAFLYARCKSWLPDIADYPTRRLLHLDLEGQDVRFPSDLVCPDLHTLWLQCRIDHSQKHIGGFFKAFKNLRFVLLKGMRFSHQQLSISALNQLRVLILDGCDVDETFLSSIPKNIETLRIWESNIPTPVHLPELKNLNKLELLVAQK